MMIEPQREHHLEFVLSWMMMLNLLIFFFKSFCCSFLYNVLVLFLKKRGQKNCYIVIYLASVFFFRALQKLAAKNYN